MAAVAVKTDSKCMFSDGSVTEFSQQNDTHADGIGNGANFRNNEYIKYRLKLTSEKDNKQQKLIPV